MVTRKDSASRDQTQHSSIQNEITQDEIQQRDAAQQHAEIQPNLAFQPPMLPEPVEASRPRLVNDRTPLWRRLSLKTKIIACTVAMSMLPAVGMGMIQYTQSQSSHSASQGSVLTHRNNGYSLLLGYLGTAALTGFLVGEMTLFFTNRIARSVLLASKTARKLGEGQLESRLAVEGSDELAVLATNLNWMAAQFQTQLNQPSPEAQTIQLLKQISLHLAQSEQVDESLKSVAQVVRQVFQFDRVLIYRIQPDAGETLVAESVNAERISVMDIAIAQPWLKPATQYTAEQVECISEVATADVSEQTLRQLTALSVKASLTAPIVFKDQLLGVFIAHRGQPYEWQSAEVEVCTQLATQIGLAWERTRQDAAIAQLAQQIDTTTQAHQDRQQALQAQLSELLKTFEQAAIGDLTVRTGVTKAQEASATQDETVSASQTCDDIAVAFDRTLENLQGVAGQIKQSAMQVETTVQANEHQLGHLQETTTANRETLTQAVSTIESLIRSLQENVAQVHQASPDLRGVLSTLETKAQSIKQNGNNLSRWADVAAAPIKQVKRFGEDCQELTQRVAIANQLLLKINTLVLNASMHPPQVGGGALGVGMMATHLAELSSQSSSAIQEIEQIIMQLQHESETVIGGVKHAISFTALGKDFVELSEQQIEQTQAISQQVQGLLQAISSTTETQIQTTQTVLDLVQQLSSGTQSISGDTTEISQSLQQILEVTRQLQTSIEAFKI